MAITLDGTNGILSPDFEPSSSTTPTNGLFLPAANTVGLATGSTERLRIDSSGNLGLGVTPSAWSNIFRALEFSTGAVRQQIASGGFGISNNSYYNGTNWIYKTSTGASYYDQYQGAHYWATAPSGTAGNAISFTQAMTLDASGNLGIGTTSPATTLHARKDSAGAITYPVYVDNGAGGAGTNVAAIGFTNAGVMKSSITAAVYGNDYMTFCVGSGTTERMRIDSSGNLLVGITSATSGGGVIQVSNGITFPATQSASSNVNTLDDYEEGTWTPVLTFGGASVGMTYVQQNGNYTKIGNFVIARAYIALSNKGTSTGAALLTGLPFTSKTVTAGYAIAKVYFNGMTGLSGADTCYLPPAATFLQLTCGGTGAIAGITSSNYANSSDNIFTICYQTD